MNTQIESEAKSILDKFAKSLDKVPTPKPTKSQAEETSRQETSPECDTKLKSRILANAPNKDQDSIIAEKASW